MTGCPNGCARPYNSDIGLVGKAAGKYTIFVGGRLLGDRLEFHLQRHGARRPTSCRRSCRCWPISSSRAAKAKRWAISAIAKALKICWRGPTSTERKRRAPDDLLARSRIENRRRPIATASTTRRSRIPPMTPSPIDWCQVSPTSRSTPCAWAMNCAARHGATDQGQRRGRHVQRAAARGAGRHCGASGGRRAEQQRPLEPDGARAVQPVAHHHALFGDTPRRLGNAARHVHGQLERHAPDLALLFLERWLEWFFREFRYGARLAA